MEIITPIEDTERLISSGVYHYLSNDQDTGIREPWTIHEQADKSRLTRVERDTGMYGIRILVEVIEQHNDITQFDVLWKDANQGFEASAHYERIDNNWQIRHTVAGAQHHATVQHTDNLIAFPLMRVFTGSVLQRLHHQPEGATVMIPNIINPNDKVNLLTPHLEKRTAHIIEQNDNQTIYQYLANNYDDSARFYVNTDGILARYTFTQKDGSRWDVHLIDGLDS